MRNLALAHLLLKAGEAEHVGYVLCAPKAHAAAWRRFTELRSAFPDAGQRTIRALHPATVATHHPDGGTALAGLYNAHGILWPAIS